MLVLTPLFLNHRRPFMTRHTTGKSRRRMLRAGLLLSISLLLLTTAGYAQAVKGSLLGTITDANGSAAAGATVTITETRTNISATTATNTDGNYSFPNL